MKKFFCRLDKFFGKKFFIRVNLAIVTISVPLKYYFGWIGKDKIISDALIGILVGLLTSLLGLNVLDKKKKEVKQIVPDLTQDKDYQRN